MGWKGAPVLGFVRPCTARFLAAVLGFIVLSIGAIAAWEHWGPDDKLNVSIIGPFNVDELGNTDDVYVGLLGLEAPSGSDFMAFGRAVREAMRMGEDIDSAVERLREGKELLAVQLSSNLNCWLEPET
jgi:hypothetical protein